VVHSAAKCQLLNFHHCGYSLLQPIKLMSDELQEKDEFVTGQIFSKLKVS
jgi:hypothetical protein